MKKIYIVLTYTGTFLSKIIKIYTRKEYSHVSIALDSKLNQMYSFGRLNPYTPIFAGFVHEKIDEGTFKRFKKTKCKVYSLEIDENQYNKLESIIKEIQQNKNTYRFNFIGLLSAALNVKIRRERHFYCAEFVKYALEQSQVLKLPEVVKPADYENVQAMKEIYRGLLQEYKR